MPPSAFVNIRRASCASHLAAGLHTAHQQILKMQQCVLLYGIHLPAEASPGILAEMWVCDSILVMDQYQCQLNPSFAIVFARFP